MVTGDWGHDVYPGSGPLDGGKTLRPAFDCIHMGIVQSTCIYHEMIVMNMRLSINYPGLGLYKTPDA